MDSENEHYDSMPSSSFPETSESALYKLKLGVYKKRPNPCGRSIIWSRFDQIYNNTGEGLKYVGYIQCKSCGKLYAYNPSKGTAVVKRHKCCQESLVGVGANSIFSKEGSSTFCTTSVTGTPSSTEETDHALWKGFQKEVQDGCVQFCAQDLRSFNTVAGTGFANIAATFVSIGQRLKSKKAIEINRLLPDPTTVSRHLGSVYEKELEILLAILKPLLKLGQVAATTDMWTESCTKRSFFTVTVHFIDELWTLQERVLFTSEYDPTESKTAENVRGHLLEQFGRLSIPEHTLWDVQFVTDRGMNIVNALTTPYKRSNCIAHLLNNTLQNSFKNIEKEAPEICKCVEKSKKLVEFFRRSAKNAQLSRSLIQEVSTRWNSHLALFKSLRETFEEVEAILSASDEAQRLDGINIALLDELIRFLEPFDRVTKALEGSSTPTSDQVVLQIEALRISIREYVNGNTELQKIAVRCLSYIEKNFVLQPYYRTALFLNPRYKQLKCLAKEEDRETAKEYLRTLSMHMSSMAMDTNEMYEETSSMSAIPLSTDPRSPTSTSSDDGFSKILHQWEDDNETNRNNSIPFNEVNEQIARYMYAKVDRNTDTLSWWRLHHLEYPKLAQVAKKLLSIPATSAPSERNFSDSGFTMNDRRTNLSAQSVNGILFIHSLHKMQNRIKNRLSS